MNASSPPELRGGMVRARHPGSQRFRAIHAASRSPPFPGLRRARRGGGARFEELEMANDTSTLKAQKRDQSGKGPARRLRAKGLVPAVCYGPFGAPLHVAVDPEAIMVAIAT